MAPDTDPQGHEGHEEASGTFGQWVGLSVSGLVLVIFVTAHIWGVHYAGDVTAERYTVKTVSARMASPTYRSFLLLLLIVALFHGLVGMRRVIDDFGGGVTARRIVNVTLSCAGLIGLVYGLLIFRALSA